MSAPLPTPTQPIRFAVPAPTPGLSACTGIARLTLCIRCDRLYASGPSIAPAAVRGVGGVYSCADQVVDGVHIATVGHGAAGHLSPAVGGGCSADPADTGAPA